MRVKEEEDIQRNTQSIRSIEQNVELVRYLSVKSPDELLRIYRYHVKKRKIFLDNEMTFYNKK